MINNKTCLLHALQECSEEGRQYGASDLEMIQFIMNRMALNDFDSSTNPEDVLVVDADVQQWVVEFVKWLATPKFTTVHEAVEYIVTQGVPRAIAKAMVNQQYVWQDNSNLLEWFDGNDNHPVPQTIGDITITMHTWEEMLELTERGVLVEGELMYDVDGDPIPQSTHSNSITRGYENGGNFS